MDPFIAEIIMFGAISPPGLALCNGQLLSIAQNTAYSRSWNHLWR